MIGLALVALAALAQAGPAHARSSGGYSRPSVSTSSRSGSSSHFGGSGGYSRPSLTPSRPRATIPSSPGDRAVSRQSSDSALRQFRTEQRPAAPEYDRPRRPSFSFPTNGGSVRPANRPSFEPQYRPPPTTEWGWTPPPTIRPNVSSYGGWNPLLFWFLLDRLAQSGNSDFFHNHQYDPGYAQWRVDADRKAQEDPAVRAQLDKLDSALAERQNEPRDPGSLPKGVSPESARASADVVSISDAPPNKGSGVTLFIVAILLIGGVVFLFYVSARHAASAASYASISGAARGKSMQGLKVAGNILRQKLGNAPLQLKPFRVGMALTLDPTPFILAKEAIKVPTPKVEGKSSFVSVTAVGAIEGAPLFRLHLTDDTFVQLHLDGNSPDECRYFAQIDEVTPGDADEWKAWLGSGEGMIGWPQFQTKDGKLYDRVWAPGSQWVEPIRYVEKLEGGGPASSVKGVMMLYGAATGLADPAPPAEYILVASVEPEGQGAWVAIHAGIDVNPAGLSLT